MLRFLHVSAQSLPWLYEIGSRWQRHFCPSWTRIRLAGLYALPLGPATDASRRPCPTASLVEEVRWIESATEARRIGRHLGSESAQQWDGDRCRGIVARRGTEDIGVLWIQRVAFVDTEIQVRHEVAESEVWLFGATVLRPFRRQGVYRQLLNYARTQLAAEGVRGLRFAVSSGNRGSELAHRRLGAELSSVMLAIRVGNWSAHFEDAGH